MLCIKTTANSGNYCSKIIDKWKKGEFELVSSLEIIKEFVRTMNNFKIKMPDEMIDEWKNIIIENSFMVEPKIKLQIIEDDSDDDKFLEAAMAGNADFIISQDKHLLKLGEYEGIKIIKPEEALLIV